MKKILVLRPAPDLLPVIKDACAPGYVVESAASQAECLGAMAATNVDFVFIDIDLLADQRNHSAKNPWKEALKPFWQANPHTEIIVTTPQDRIRDAVNAVKAGAGNYLALPINSDELKYVLDSILDSKLMQSELDYLRDSFWSDESADIIRTKSAAMKEVFDKIRMVAPTNTTVLLSGETGTGKGVLAKLIHSHSKRRPAQFISVHCGAIPDTLIESELFGHVKGAFTSANADREGAFELADGGTVFLDEIGDLSPDLQPKLLRVLEKREIRRVGENRIRKINVRIICATNRMLAVEVNEGRFREDLYYRLSVLQMELPPLRRRRDDVPLLLKKFLVDLHGPTAMDSIADFDRTMDVLKRHDWPGNVRELRNLIEVAFYSSHRPLDLSTFLSLGRLHAGRKPEAEASYATDKPFKDAKNELIEGFEKAYLQDLLARNSSNISKSAREAGIERAYLQRLIKKYELK